MLVLTAVEGSLIGFLVVVWCGVAWLSDNVLVSISVVTVLWAQLILRWVTDRLWAVHHLIV